MNDLLSVVSVDVLALTYDPTTRRVLLGLYRRPDEPFAGQLCLPGVVLHSGERLAGAGRRALLKLGLVEPDVLRQVHTFDEPLRDPRGPSLSVALCAVLAWPAAGASGAVFIPVGGDALPRLGFDHSDIVRTCLARIGALLWRDLELSKALLPSEFQTVDARAITRDITGVDPSLPNLNRTLDALPGVRRVGQVAEGRGRPVTVRTFD